jgi:hypothetical protein
MAEGAAMSMEEIQSKSLRELFYWREYRQSSPLPSAAQMWNNYKIKYMSGKVPSGQIIWHLIYLTAGVGFIAHYGKNSNHLFSKHH